ncbi:MAG: class I tRNA ligase family protein [Candidatus Paceibacterota bacterium]|nr:MAG: class I tRNA ligase family protein [Candidatus Paceibacterota bacterium]
MKEYDHKKIEKKWQREWAKSKIYKTTDKNKGKKNFYTLVEIPYPSGNLHVGHWYAFSVPDIFARYKRMSGENVMFPIGFDAFGLPAENAAIKKGLNPRKWTYDNIKYMENQLQSMGASFDWSRKIITADPEYYCFTQWMFTEFFKKGLAYQKKTPANWCPSCKTVLANEQVVDGKCERCDSEVEKKEILQWNLKITDYAERLLSGLDNLSWPEPIKNSQRNWIGKSDGAEIEFQLLAASFQKNSKLKAKSQKLAAIKVFTTRPDTIFGATYLVLAPEHEFIQEQITNNESQITNKSEIQKYVDQSKKKTEIERTAEGKEKSGVELKGIKAINPATKEEIPIFVADYVLSGYGTGAIMAVPADDKRDQEFAEKFNLPIIKDYTPAGFEDFGKKVVKYKLRDWGVSRQRYWGVPIPIIHCEKCGQVPVPDKDLPVKLPEIKDYLPRDDGRSPLAKAEKWVNVKCPNCKGKAERETDTLDTFVDSSWYFLRYTDPKNKKEFASKKKMENWMPVDFYSGGAEHNTMHLLYSRFWQKALYDFGLVKDEEPYKTRMNRGLILGPDGNKMSKSKGNIVDPDEIVRNLGADTIRMYLAFIGPFNEVGSFPWSTDGIVGVRRFLEKVWNLKNKLQITNDKTQKKPNPEIENLMHQTIKKVGEDIESLKINTAVSQLMIFVNALTKQEKIFRKEFEILLVLLAPFAPHLTEELWHKLGNPRSIHLTLWPKYDQSKIQGSKTKIGIQIDGKIRDILEVENDASEDEIKSKALESEAVKKWLANREVKKIIYIKGKILSIVLT